MNSKKQFLDYIGEVKNIISTLEISDNKLSEIQGNITGAELIVPVVGGFSAGKSTLLNSFLGNEILPTAVTPETALATELRYSDSNYIEAVTASGAVERHQLADFARLKDNAQNFKNLRVYLNNENLKALLKDDLNNKSIIAVFGSEGGISENEISILTKSEFKMVSLGKRILRAETAPLYLVSCIAYFSEFE